MKFLFALIVLFITAFANGQDSSFALGNEAYANSDFETALNEYNKVVGSELMSAELYYNLGNTYYKLDQLGEAIWAYERALKIDPNNENAVFNLKFANSKTYDDIESDDSGIGHWLRMNLFQFSINFWAYFSIIMSFAFALAIYFFATTKKQKIKNRALTASFTTLALLIFMVIIAYFNKNGIVDRKKAIIITEFIEVHPSPSDTSPSDFKLHEGTKVDLLRANDDWTEINVNGNTGWVKKEAIWEI